MPAQSAAKTRVSSSGGGKLVRVARLCPLRPRSAVRELAHPAFRFRKPALPPLHHHRIFMRAILAILVFASCAPGSATASGATPAGFSIDWYSIDGGGGVSVSADS